MDHMVNLSRSGLKTLSTVVGTETEVETEYQSLEKVSKDASQIAGRP